MTDYDDTGFSETTLDDHAHECECGTWLCNDETCEPEVVLTSRIYPPNYGWRLCPYCEGSDAD